MKKEKVILINASPGNAPTKLIPKNLPLAILSVAAPIADSYDVVLIDRAVHPEDKKLRQALQEGPIACVGISCLTGPPIVDSIHCSKLVKEFNPDIPVLWGGWHATIAPQSILEKPYVDFVIQGEGERAFEQFLAARSDREALEAIPGLGWMSDEGMKVNPAAKKLNLDEIPRMPVRLLDSLEPYIYYNALPGGGRCLCWESSRGCPFTCTFCEIPKRFGITYAFQSPERMIEDAKWLQEHHGIGGIRYFDPNFFLKVDRARAFSQALIDENIKLKWSGTGTISQFKNIPLETLKFFAQAGLSFVEFGVESGDEQLRYSVLKKRFKDADFDKVLRHFREAGIQCKFNIMIGFPGESYDQSLATVRFTLDVLKNNPNSSIGGHMYMYIPFPDTELFEKACEYGYQRPSKLEDFADLNHSGNNSMPWLEPGHRKTVESASLMSYFLSQSANSIPFTGIKRLAFKVARGVYLYRLRNRVFARTPDLALLERLIS